MCDPVSIGIATFALGATQSVMQHVGTNKAFEANQEASNLSYAQESNAIARQEAQTDRAYSENVLDTAITTLKAQGEVAAGASQQGLASSSIVRAINADMFGIGRQATVEEQNYRTEKIDLGERRYGAALQRNRS